jgi:hypothetical protein
MKTTIKNTGTHETSENSVLRLVKEMDDNATRLLNNASLTDHNVIDAAIYLSKAAEELKNGVIKNARSNSDVVVVQEIKHKKNKYHMKKIVFVLIGLICCILTVHMINSYSENTITPSVLTTTTVEQSVSVVPTAEQSIVTAPVVKPEASIVKEEEKIPYANNEVFKKEKVISAIVKHLGGVFTGKSTYIYTNCKKYNVNPMLVTAIMKHETGNGTSKMVKVQHNPAGISTLSGGFVTYKSLDSGIMSLIKLLKSYYIDRGLTSIETIGAVFCPISDVRDVNKLNKSWIPTVAKYYKEILADSKE